MAEFKQNREDKNSTLHSTRKLGNHSFHSHASVQKTHTRVFKIPVQLSQTRFLATSPNLYWLSVSLDTHFEPGCLKLVKIADSDCVKNVSKQMAIFLFEDVPLVEFMYFVFTRMPGESYRRRLGSLFLCLCCVF